MTNYNDLTKEQKEDLNTLYSSRSDRRCYDDLTSQEKRYYEEYSEYKYSEIVLISINKQWKSARYDDIIEYFKANPFYFELTFTRQEDARNKFFGKNPRFYIMWDGKFILEYM